MKGADVVSWMRGAAPQSMAHAFASGAPLCIWSVLCTGLAEVAGVDRPVGGRVCVHCEDAVAKLLAPLVCREKDSR